MCKRETLSLYPVLVLMTTVVLRGILRLLFPTTAFLPRYTKLALAHLLISTHHTGSAPTRRRHKVQTILG